jgi:hypothetical protein
MSSCCGHYARVSADIETRQRTAPCTNRGHDLKTLWPSQMIATTRRPLRPRSDAGIDARPVGVSLRSPSARRNGSASSSGQSGFAIPRPGGARALATAISPSLGGCFSLRPRCSSTSLSTSSSTCASPTTPRVLEARRGRPSRLAGTGALAPGERTGAPRLPTGNRARVGRFTVEGDGSPHPVTHRSNNTGSRMGTELPWGHGIVHAYAGELGRLDRGGLDDQPRPGCAAERAQATR